MLPFLSVVEDNDDNVHQKLEALYMKYREDMFRVAYRILDDYQLAQDAVQTAFIKIMDNLNKINDINCSRTRAFVVIIVRNISINLYRKRKRQNYMLLENVEDTIPDDSESIDDKIITADIFNQVSLKIHELQTTYSDIISLKYFYQYSDDEIAKLLDITQGNVRVRLYRARKSLIKLLSQDGELNMNE